LSLLSFAKEGTVQPIRLAHVDDDFLIRERVRVDLEDAATPRPLAVTSVGSLAEALAVEAPVDLWLLDVDLAQGPDADGVALTTRLRRRRAETVIVMYAAHLEALERAMVAGADDFILKSTRGRDLGARLYSTFVLAARGRAGAGDAAGHAVGATMRALAARVPRLVDSAVRSIYVFAESGAGKEVFVDLLAARLPPRTPLVRVNCAAISPHLLESELFGHVKGAFTGAIADKKGYLAAAHGGWLFLDEIASLSLPAQAALLRALEAHEIVRVGDALPQRIDVRVVGASNVDLAALARRGGFRQDLLQRLREVEITLPPLRERRGEIDELIDHFCAREDGGPYRMSDEARALLRSCAWRSGNVRALRNCIRAMTERRVDRLLTPLSLPAWFWREREADGTAAGADAAPAGAASVRLVTPDAWTLPLALRDERGAPRPLEALHDELLAKLLERWRVAYPQATLRGVATALGVAKTSLQRRVARLIELELLGEEDVAHWRPGRKEEAS
jgi:DNA-binding NtrC family response regulator